ncbi:MAG: cytochrome C [Vicinamibacteria bacterium]
MLKKIIVSLLAVVVVAVSGVLAFVFGARPLSRPALQVSADATPERLARGEYLALTTGCIDCHSKRDFNRYAGPPVTPYGAHADGFDKGVGVPGVVYPPNLTSDKETGLGSWTDGEILRAMREGVSRNGRPLFPLMPYSEFKSLSDEDALSIVAFLRTLPAEKYAAPAPQLDFPMPLIVRLIPKPLAGPVTGPARTDTLAYGKYLTGTMGCTFCHSTADAQMSSIPGREWAGDNEFRGPWGVVRSANLTPHETGMGDKTKENFIGLFRAFGNVDGELPKGAQNTIMPWALYNKLTDEDLGIVYDYLKSQKPVSHAVEKFPKTPRA